MDKQLTQLDKQLQEIAVKDWTKFVQMVGEDAVSAAKMCLLRQAGNTYGEISLKLDKPRQTVVSVILRECKC